MGCEVAKKRKGTARKSVQPKGKSWQKYRLGGSSDEI